MAQYTLDQIKAMSPTDQLKLINDMAAKNTRKVSFKVTAPKADGSGSTGAVSVYGIHSRFPVTLYASQWETLFAHVPALTKFIADNAATVARK
jgi:hypothetical protein